MGIYGWLHGHDVPDTVSSTLFTLYYFNFTVAAQGTVIISIFRWVN